MFLCQTTFCFISVIAVFVQTGKSLIYFPLLWYSSALLLQCFVGNYCVLFGGQIRQKWPIHTLSHAAYQSNCVHFTAVFSPCFCNSAVYRSDLSEPQTQLSSNTCEILHLYRRTICMRSIASQIQLFLICKPIPHFVTFQVFYRSLSRGPEFVFLKLKRWLAKSENYISLVSFEGFFLFISLENRMCARHLL